MQRRIPLLAVLAAVGIFSATAQAQNPPGTRTPVRQPTTSPPPATPVPQQTVRPTQTDPVKQPSQTATPTRTDPVPPAARGVGATGSKPDCSTKKGLEKSECERRDTSRDDLPAGVTTTQPEKKPQQ